MEGHFTQGEEVEVANQEEAFAGSWYVATIIHPSKRKKTLFYIVEYKTLTEETESKPLREFIPGSNIRPRPPPEDFPIFEPNDDVDAYFNDGWWKGVVIKVLEENKYVVYIDSTKEQREFGRSDLRTRLDWIAGKWLKSQQRGKMEPVEVSFDDENFRGAWFPATVLREIGNTSFLVEYRSSRDGDNVLKLKETVHSRHVRPPPNGLVCKTFFLQQRVDAFYDFGWWSGVISRILPKNRYVVFFKHQSKEMEFNQSELRPHMEWIGQKWVADSRETSDIQHSQGGIESPIRTGSTAVTSEMVNQPSPSEDTLKRKSPSSPLSSDQMMTPASTNKPALKIKLTTSRISAEDSHPCKKLMEDLERKNPMLMKACHVSGASSGNVTDMDMTPVPRSKRSKISHSKGRINSVSIIKNYIKDDDVSSSHHNGKTSNDLESEVAASRETVDTILLTESAGSMDHIAEYIVPSSRKRGRPNKSDSSTKRSAKGNEQKTSGRRRGRPRKLVSTLSRKRDQLQATDSSSKTSETGVEPKKSRGRPKALDSSIELLTKGPEAEEACERQIAENSSMKESAVADHCEDDQLPLVEMFKKFISPMEENSGISAEKQSEPNKVTTVGDELLDFVELENSLSFVDQILLDKLNNEREDEQNGTTLTSSDATRQGDYGPLPQSLPSIPINSAESLNRNAEKQSMLLVESDSSLTGQRRGVSPEKRIMPCEAFPMEDSSAEIHGEQSALVIVDKHTVLAESSTSTGEQNETAILPFEVDTTKNSTSPYPTQCNEGDVPQSSPFVKSPLLSPIWKGVGSMCGFSSISQQPHFRGLEQFNEELQEGMALGYMASFVNVVDKICTATLDEPQSSLEKKLSALNYLEELGFTVQPVRSRIHELLKIKENHEHLEDVLKEVERQIITESTMSGRLDAQSEELQKTINELNKRLQCVMAQIEMKGSEVAELEKKQDEIRKNIQEAKHDYDRVRAARW